MSRLMSQLKFQKDICIMYRPMIFRLRLEVLRAGAGAGITKTREKQHMAVSKVQTM